MTQNGAIQDAVARGGTRRGKFIYDDWMDSHEVPIHRGYFIEDLRTVEVGPWHERECNAAFIQVSGMEGVAEARITELPPGASAPPLKFALDEVVYTLAGHGIATVWTDGVDKHSFEFGPRSLFLIPRGAHRQFANARGDQPLRLLHNNYLPVAMSLEPDPDFYFNNPYGHPELLQPREDELYAVAKRAPNLGRGATWYGNYFTDMAAWNDLVPHRQRGGGGHVVDVSFPNSQMGGHMSVFPPGTYKKGHRHGPGRVIVIPAGEGYSILWPEGGEKIIAPWHEGQHVHAARPLVPPALQRQRRTRPLPRPRAASPVRRPQREGGGPQARPDRVPVRGTLDPREVRGRASTSEGWRASCPTRPTATPTSSGDTAPTRSRAPCSDAGGTGRVYTSTIDRTVGMPDFARLQCSPRSSLT